LREREDINMAKPLGAKSLLIRDAIKAHPKMGNTGLAKLINSSDARKEDKIEVKAADVAQQRQAMKKLAEGPAATAALKPKKKPGTKPKAAIANAAPATTKAQASPADVIDGVLTLAKKCGGLGELKRLVDRMAQG
jgi:hypothetical protein